MVTKIYHNTRCSKSREALSLLKRKTEDIEIIDYLKKTLSYSEIVEVLSYLKLEPIEIIRKQEEIWKKKFKDKSMSNKEIIIAITNHPKIMERPIIIKNKKAVIGRPPEKVLTLFS